MSLTLTSDAETALAADAFELAVTRWPECSLRVNGRVADVWRGGVLLHRTVARTATPDKPALLLDLVGDLAALDGGAP